MLLNKIIKYLLILGFLYCYYLSKIYINDFYFKDYIVFLNSGNGDAILISSEDKYLLLDGGDSTYSLNNLYKYTNLKFPTNYAISHFHLDHVAGLIPLLNSSTTYYDIYAPSTFIKAGEFKKYFFNTQSTNYKTLKLNDTLKIGSLKLQVLAPSDNCNFSKDPNICSLVLLLTSESGFKVMLLGDIPAEQQTALLTQLDGGIDVLKVPHQGSDNSLNKYFSSGILPKAVVFSVGENKYGHPKPQVVDFYKNIGSKIYRTDKDGDVIFVIK